MSKTIILSETFVYVQKLGEEAHTEFLNKLKASGISTLDQKKTKNGTIYFAEIK